MNAKQREVVDAYRNQVEAIRKPADPRATIAVLTGLAIAELCKANRCTMAKAAEDVVDSLLESLRCIKQDPSMNEAWSGE